MIHNLFPTPIFSYSINEDKMDKEKYIGFLYKLKNNDQGVNRSNVGSWHSSPNINLFKFQELKQLKEFILDSVQKSINTMGYGELKFALSESWSIISPKGAYNKKHIHPGGFLSGSYYVSTPEAPITFYDPRPVRAFCNPKITGAVTPYNIINAIVKPREGDLLIFPSWLEHSVSENTSNQDRVIISFNFNLV